LTYTPSSGLIGTPTQTQFGVEFSVLLDPRIKAQLPLLTVEIQEAIISQFAPNPVQTTGQVPYPLQSDGVYTVFEVRHRGDSRGNPWQTDVTAASIQGNVLAALVGAA
jgi:hypothetical protein